jgi:hypothetical protein
VEFLRDKAAERESLAAEVQRSKDVDFRQAAMKQIAILDEILDGTKGNGAGGDKLVEYWEHCLEAGIDPDLDMTVEELE